MISLFDRNMFKNTKALFVVIALAATFVPASSYATGGHYGSSFEVELTANNQKNLVLSTSTESFVLKLETEGAKICELVSPNSTGVAVNSEATVVPGESWYPAEGETITFTVKCWNFKGEKKVSTATVHLPVYVAPEPAPDVTVDIKANDSDGPVEINEGDSYVYTWVSTGADICEITSPTNSGVALSGTSTPVVLGDIEYPTASSSVTLTIKCSNSEKEATDSVVVKLKEKTVPPPTEKKATIVASKIVCENETDLPNWSGTSNNITKDTATNFVAGNENCELVSGWDFQWATSDANDPGGDFVGEASAPWVTFTASTTISIPSDKFVWVREVLKSGYINFSGDSDNLPGSNVSAEMYCNTDVLNYDNYDFIDGMQDGKTYYCVAWNVQKKDVPPPAPDVTVDIKANDSDGPVEINEGDSYVYTWVSTGADICEITSPTNSGVALSGTSTPVVLGDIEYPTASSSVTLTIKCSNSEKEATDSVVVKLKENGGPGPSISVDLVANPDTIKEGATSTLSWTSSGADSCNAAWTSSVSASSTEVVSPATTTVYSITCNGPAGTATDTATVTVDPIVKANLTADPSSITKGATSTLSWTSENADICEAEWTTSVSTSGNQIVSPSSTTTYTIVCTGPKGVATSTATITVTEQPTNPPSNPPSGGGGGGRGSSRASGTSAPAVCYYLRDYLRIDFNNDPSEVIKLQAFLAVFEGHNLNVTGVFDQATLEAVNAFQVKYFADVLEPWGHTGPTGYVYYTTQKKINEIYCQRMFPLNSTQEQEIAAFKALLESLNAQGSGSNPSTPVVPIVGVGGGDDVESPSASSSIPVVGLENGENDSKGQNFRSLAAAIFAQPETLADAAECGYKFLLIIIVLYVLGAVLKDILYSDTAENAKKRFLAKWITITVGLAAAVLFAYFLKWWCVILPLLIAFIVSAVWLLTYNNRDNGKGGKPLAQEQKTPIINLPPTTFGEEKEAPKGFSGVHVNISASEEAKK